LKHSEFELVSFLAIAVAILATMFVTYLCLAYARNVIERVGPLGIDAITRIVGFFVATMGGRTHFPWSGRSPSGLWSSSCALNQIELRVSKIDKQRDPFTRLTPDHTNQVGNRHLSFLPIQALSRPHDRNGPPRPCA
jgi:hypothetical protein